MLCNKFITMYVLRTCAREHDGQPNLPYGQPNFKVVGHLASSPEKLFLTLCMYISNCKMAEYYYKNRCMHGFVLICKCATGLKGLPVVGCAPMFIRAIRSLKAGEDHMLHKLQVQFGPIYRLKMFGWYFCLRAKIFVKDQSISLLSHGCDVRILP